MSCQTGKWHTWVQLRSITAWPNFLYQILINGRVSSWKITGKSKKWSENSVLKYSSFLAINSLYIALPDIYLRRNISVTNGKELTSTVRSYVYNNLVDYTGHKEIKEFGNLEFSKCGAYVLCCPFVSKSMSDIKRFWAWSMCFTFHLRCFPNVFRHHIYIYIYQRLRWSSG